jgi:hypothetical protein
MHSRAERRNGKTAQSVHAFLRENGDWHRDTALSDNAPLKHSIRSGRNTPPVLPVPFFSSLSVEPSLCSIFVMRLYVY